MNDPKAKMDKIKAIITEVFQIDASVITMETTPSDIEAWDSLGQLLLIQKIEETYRLTLDLKEILNIKTVGDIYKILESRG